MTNIHVAEAAIAKLDVAPGDTVGVRTDRILLPEDIDCLRTTMRSALPPGVNVVILDGGFTLEVLKAAA